MSVMRVLLAVVCGGISGTLICCSLKSRESLTHAHPISEQSHSFHWTPVTSETADTLANRVAHLALDGLLESGVPNSRARALGDDLTVLLAACMNERMDAYLERMLARGAILDDIADGTTKYHQEGRRYAASGWKTQSLIEQVKYLWSHPVERGMKWSAIDISHVQSGVGLVAQNGVDWPERSHSTQLSLLAAPTGRLTQDRGEEIKDSTRAAWVQFPVLLKPEFQTHIRFMFYFDDDLSVWFPFACMVGTDSRNQPLPLM